MTIDPPKVRRRRLGWDALAMVHVWKFDYLTFPRDGRVVWRPTRRWAIRAANGYTRRSQRAYDLQEHQGEFAWEVPDDH